MVPYCNESQGLLRTRTMVMIDEVLGKGLEANLDVDQQSMTVIIGNEAHLANHDVISPELMSALKTWKVSGESVTLVACSSASRLNDVRLTGMFSIADPHKPEAISGIQALKKRGIHVWMLLGDNSTLANALGTQVGISATNILRKCAPR